MKCQCAICDLQYEENEGSFSLKYDDSGAFFVCNPCHDHINVEGAVYEDNEESYNEGYLS